MVWPIPLHHNFLTKCLNDSFSEVISDIPQALLGLKLGKLNFLEYAQITHPWRGKQYNIHTFSSNLNRWKEKNYWSTRAGKNKKVLKNRSFQSYLAPLFHSVLVHNLSYSIWNEFDLDENEPLGRIHFHINRFTLTLVLTEAKGNSEMTYYQKNIFLLVW